MTNRWTSQELHEELAIYYRQFANLPAPKNTFTEDLWLRIAKAEAEEAPRRGKA